jgi:flagellar hook-basal body complex protein FliE
MANLNLENLNKIVQTGDVQQLFGGNLSQVSSDAKVQQEMQAQGMAPQAPHLDGKTFSDVLRDSVDKVNTFQVQADTAIKELVAGRNKNIHETMLTIERADTSLKLMMQVRNKILDAYKEIMRMQV